MIHEVLLHKMERALKMQGDLYDLEHIVEQIQNGDMQGYIRGNSWAVTSITDYPKRRVMDLILVVGDLADCLDMECDILDYGREQGCSLIRADGRQGWDSEAKKRGWRQIANTYYKDL